MVKVANTKKDIEYLVSRKYLYKLFANSSSSKKQKLHYFLVELQKVVSASETIGNIISYLPQIGTVGIFLKAIAGFINKILNLDI